MTRVAIAGACGRMGRLLVEGVLSSEYLELAAAFDLVEVGRDIGEIAGRGKVGVPVSDAKKIEDVLATAGTDVLIDFTVAHAAVENIEAAARQGVNLVVGTTGFTPEQMERITSAVEGRVAAVVSPNFSVGVNVFWKILLEAAILLKGYDAEVIETHHNKKKDAPSGTALRAAEVIRDAWGGADFVFGREGIMPRQPGEIGVHAVRVGDVVGEHTVIFGTDGERFEITHRAHSRQAFAQGALRAAKWIMGAEPGLYGMGDVLGL